MTDSHGTTYHNAMSYEKLKIKEKKEIAAFRA